MMSTPPLPRGLYAICDDTARPDLPLERQAQSLLEGGVRVLQVRIKRTPPGPALESLRQVVRACRERGALCLVNDRVDYALLCEADGVHLGQEDLPPEEARKLLGPRRIIGATVRNLEQSRAAAAKGADYVGLGPIFPTSTKSVPASLVGLEGLRTVANGSPLPVVAISGIGAHNIAEVAAAGAHAAAVVSELLRAQDLSRKARSLAEAFEEGRRYAAGQGNA